MASITTNSFDIYILSYLKLYTSYGDSFFNVIMTYHVIDRQQKKKRVKMTCFFFMRLIFLDDDLNLYRIRIQHIF